MKYSGGIKSNQNSKENNRKEKRAKDEPNENPRSC
jgi:hypothetical protein